jgi:uncharacterized protein (TIGR00725 family)
MVKRTIIGVMGGGRVSPEAADTAYRLGELVAAEGWVLLNGGRAAGVMEASARGAADRGGLTVGILPDRTPEAASDAINLPICTGMGDARNCINVLSSDVVIACQGGGGTLSEVALALKNGKPVIALGFDAGGALAPWVREGLLVEAKTPEEAVAIARAFVGSGEEGRSQ